MYHIRIAKLGYSARRLEGNPVTKHQCFQMLSKFRVGDIQDQGPRPHCPKDEKIAVSKGLAPTAYFSRPLTQLLNPFVHVLHRPG
jgi:hypothetical protein